MGTATRPHGAPGRSAAELAEVAELGEEARALLRPEHHPRQFVTELAAAGLFADAVRALAHALPKREAVWWGWMTARRALAGRPVPPNVQASLDATERWMTNPSDENRRAAMAAAESAGTDTAAGAAGVAAFASGGSLGPAELAPIPPGEFLTAKAVFGAVMIGAAGAEPEKAPERLAAAVEQGLDVAARINLWPPAPPPAGRA